MGLFKRARASVNRSRESWKEAREKVDRARLMEERERKHRVKTVSASRAALTDYTRRERSFDVEGLFAYPIELRHSRIRLGSQVHLVREPDNTVDRNAVGIVGPTNAGIWGYMPAETAARYAGPIDRGATFKARVVELNHDGGEITYVRVHVSPIT